MKITVYIGWIHEICRSKYTKYQAQLQTATSFHQKTNKRRGTGS